MATLLVNSATLLTQRTAINSAFIEINSLGVQVGSLAAEVSSIDASGTGGMNFVTGSADITLSGTSYMADTRSGPFGLTLPNSPAADFEVLVKDDRSSFTDTNKLTIIRSGTQKIMDLSENLDLTYADAWVVLKYRLAFTDWRIKSGS